MENSSLSRNPVRVPAYLLKVSWVLLGISAALLIVNVIGQWQPPLSPPSTSTRTGIPGREFRTIEIAAAHAQYSDLKNSDLDLETKAQKLFALISGSYLHAPSYRRTIFDNWYVWLRGLRAESFLRTVQDVDLLWRRGGGFCTQAAMIYAAKGQELGLETRIALLTGHVVAEVLIPGKGWRVVDPDLKVFWEYSLSDFGKSIGEEEIKKKLIEVGYSADFSSTAAQIYLSQEDNRLVNYPMDAMRLQFEKDAEWRKWLFPSLMMMLSIFILIKGRLTARSR